MPASIPNSSRFYLLTPRNPAQLLVPWCPLADFILFFYFFGGGGGCFDNHVSLSRRKNCVSCQSFWSVFCCCFSWVLGSFFPPRGCRPTSPSISGVTDNSCCHLFPPRSHTSESGSRDACCLVVIFLSLGGRTSESICGDVLFSCNLFRLMVVPLGQFLEAYCLVVFSASGSYKSVNFRKRIA